MRNQLLDLIRATSCDLPAESEAVLQPDSEAHGSPAQATLEQICRNVAIARQGDRPICQDTGTLSFFFNLPDGTKVLPIAQAAREAVREATANGWLRNNTIETLSGRSINDNVLAPHAPVLHFDFNDQGTSEVTLLMKGGGSENMSCQYTLPDSALKANRNLDGVRKCILDAVNRIQGQGCAPGTLGVCIGGDRAEGYAAAKRQLLRQQGERASDPDLAAFEMRLLKEANSLGIGPMGLGGKVTLTDIRITALPRLPASYFVTIAYLCWAARRRTRIFRIG